MLNNKDKYKILKGESQLDASEADAKAEACRDLQQLIIQEELHELNRDEYEQFDDYIEMVITFGYITMFASFFVIVAAAVFVFIYIESRSDLFKLENNMRRPLPFKTHNIGSWIYTLEIFGFLAIFSNIIGGNAASWIRPVGCFCH